LDKTYRPCRSSFQANDFVHLNCTAFPLEVTAGDFALAADHRRIVGLDLPGIRTDQRSSGPLAIDLRQRPTPLAIARVRAGLGRELSVNPLWQNALLRLDTNSPSKISHQN
jgi:hypothetical protein